MKFNINKYKGFSLIEISIALGVISTLVLTGLTVNQLLQDSSKSAEQMGNVMTLASTLRQRLAFSDLCADSIGAAGGQNMGNINSNQLKMGKQQVQVLLPGAEAGPNRDENVLQQGQIIAKGKVQILDLIFSGVENIGGNTYIGQLQLNAQSIGGIPFKPIFLGNIQFDLTGVGGGQSITTCAGISSSVNQDICVSMGCTWNTLPAPGCTCKTVNSLCPLGQYPTAFTATGPTCVSLGNACPAGQYLTSVGIGTSTCALLPAAGAASCPSGSSATGVGALTSTPGCRCINFGDTWDGTSCINNCYTGCSQTCLIMGSVPGLTSCGPAQCSNFCTTGSEFCSIAGTSPTGLGGSAGAPCNCNNVGETLVAGACVPTTTSCGSTSWVDAMKCNSSSVPLSVTTQMDAFTNVWAVMEVNCKAICAATPGAICCDLQDSTGAPGPGGGPGVRCRVYGAGAVIVAAPSYGSAICQ